MCLEVRRLLRRHKPNVDKVTFRIYQDRQRPMPTSWPNNLDYIDDSNIPHDQFIGDAYQERLP